MNDAPLGIFDSGVGGLTVVRAVQDLLPAEDIVYLGDTARVPYGSKSPETIRVFAEQDLNYLLDRGVKAVVVACNTATAHALKNLQELCNIPVIGVIESGVTAALADGAVEKIGIIATRGTIRSHAYQHALAQRKTGLMIHAVATPLLVPLVEEDWIDHPVSRSILEAYLQPLIDKGIDALLLACTHYPLLIPRLTEILPPGVALIDSATTCASHLRQVLSKSELLAESEGQGKLEIALTDLSEEFESLAGRFLHRRPGRIKRVIIDR